MRPLRKLLTVLVVLLALTPAFVLQPASAQPVEELQLLCVHRSTGEVRAVQDAADCTRYETLVDLIEDGPVNACANRSTGVIAIREDCTRHEEPVALGGEESVTLCISRATGQLRYSPSGSCGRGETSGTVPGVPSTFSADCLTTGDCPQTITEFYGAGDVTDRLTVAAASGTITDVNVTVDVVAEDIIDIELSLTSPGGTTVALLDNACNDGDEELQVVFDDDGAALNCGALTGFNAYQPVGSLTTFNGSEANGEWTLTVNVETVADGMAGVLLNWSLAITTTEGATEVACTACMVPFPDDSIDLTVGGTVSALAVDVPPAATITDLDVILNITHTWVGNLHIFVVSPAGTSVRLFEEACGTAGDLEVIYDDEASGALDCATRLGFNRFQPVGSLATFDGEAAAGTWHLVILDDSAPGRGTLNTWTLDFELS